MKQSGFLTFETLYKTKTYSKILLWTITPPLWLFLYLHILLPQPFPCQPVLFYLWQAAFYLELCRELFILTLAQQQVPQPYLLGVDTFLVTIFKASIRQTSKSLNEELEKNGKSYLLTLRLIPIFPFFLVNLMSGLSTIALTTFVWTTAIGIIPGSFVYAYAGSQLSSIQTTEDIVSPSILLALVMLGILSLIPTVYGKVQQRKGES